MIYSILLLLSFLFVSCKDNPLSTDEKSQRGTISGVVLDSSGLPLPGVSITTVPEGFTTVSDSLGGFTIPNIPRGSYRLSYSHPFFRDTLSSDIRIAKAEELYDLEMILKLSARFQGYTVLGELTGDLSDVAEIVVKISSDDLEDQYSQSVAWYPQSKTYSGNFIIPRENREWLAEVFVYNSTERLTGYQSMPFSRLLGSVVIPSFSAQSAYPQIILNENLKRSVFRGGEVAQFHFSVDHIYGVPDKYEIRLKGGEKWIEIDSGRAEFAAPSGPDFDSYLELRVTDSHGNISMEQVGFSVDIWLDEINNFTALKQFERDDSTTFIVGRDRDIGVLKMVRGEIHSYSDSFEWGTWPNISYHGGRFFALFGSTLAIADESFDMIREIALDGRSLGVDPLFLGDTCVLFVDGGSGVLMNIIDLSSDRVTTSSIDEIPENTFWGAVNLEGGSVGVAVQDGNGIIFYRISLDGSFLVEELFRHQSVSLDYRGVQLINSEMIVFSGSSSSGAFLSAFSMAGDLLWDRSFYAHSISLSPCGGAAVLLRMNKISADLIALGDGGETLWQKPIPSKDDAVFLSPLNVMATQDGGWHILQTFSFGGMAPVCVYVKSDSRGGMLSFDGEPL